MITNPLLSQHFIKDTSVLESILAQLNKDSTVIEIGSGTGVLTEKLAQKVKKVIALEIDPKFENPLNLLKNKYPNTEIVFGDALSNDLNNLINKESKDDLFIVSNLPYHITEPFVFKLTLLKVPAILMVGKKFGLSALTSDSNNPNFGELSFVCGAFFEIEKLEDVPREAFEPEPDTDSMVLKFKPKKAENKADFVKQNLIITQKHGGLVKNILMEGLIDFEKMANTVMTKNQARDIVSSLHLSDEILNKSFAQLNNDEVKSLAKVIEEELT